MNKALSIILAVVFAFVIIPAKAQDDPAPLNKDQKKEVVAALTADYTPWKTMSMSGKLSSAMLPLSVTTKIYMEKDELVVISLSAIFVGEAARIEIDKEKAIIVNKMSNRYTTLEMVDIENMCPGGLSALQDLLLRRVFILNSGELSTRNMDKMELYEVGENCLVAFPDQDLETAEFLYMYTLGMPDLTLDTFSVVDSEGEEVVEINYAGNKGGLTLDMGMQMRGKRMEATLKLNAPDRVAKPIERFVPGKKYEETSLRGVMSF